MLNRWIEGGLLDALEEVGAGCITFSPLAQGMLTDRYLEGVPTDSRAAQGKSLSPDLLTEQNMTHIRALHDLALRRGQTLAQLALAVDAARLAGHDDADRGELRPAARGQPRRRSTDLDFSDDELAEIDRFAVDGGINLWHVSSDA